MMHTVAWTSSVALHVRSWTLACCLFVSCTAAHACSCVERDGTLDEQVAADFATHDVVAIMEVAGTERSTQRFADSSVTDRWVVLVPSHVFKGSVFPGQRFYSPAPGRVFRTSCETKIQTRELVLVYANDGEPVGLRWCDRSGLLTRRYEQVRALFELTSDRR